MSTEETVPWRDAFPTIPKHELPGRMLKAAMDKEGMVEQRLATILGLPISYIFQIENGHIPITEDMAKFLGEILKVHYSVFLVE